MDDLLKYLDNRGRPYIVQHIPVHDITDRRGVVMTRCGRRVYYDFTPRSRPQDGPVPDMIECPLCKAALIVDEWTPPMDPRHWRQQTTDDLDDTDHTRGVTPAPLTDNNQRR